MATGAKIFCIFHLNEQKLVPIIIFVTLHPLGLMIIISSMLRLAEHQSKERERKGRFIDFKMSISSSISILPILFFWNELFGVGISSSELKQ